MRSGPTVERDRGEQLRQVDAQAEVVGGDVTAAEPREGDPATLVDEDRRRPELAVDEAATVQGAGEPPDRGEPGVVELAVDLAERRALRLVVGDDGRERPHL